MPRPETRVYLAARYVPEPAARIAGTMSDPELIVTGRDRDQATNVLDYFDLYEGAPPVLDELPIAGAQLQAMATAGLFNKLHAYLVGTITGLGRIVLRYNAGAAHLHEPEYIGRLAERPIRDGGGLRFVPVEAELPAAWRERYGETPAICIIFDEGEALVAETEQTRDALDRLIRAGRTGGGRTWNLSAEDLAKAMLQLPPRPTLDADSAEAAGEAYTTRHQRNTP